MADVVVASQFGWQIEFAQSPDPDIEFILKSHFPEVAISSSFIPFKNVEVFSTRSPGPPRFTKAREPRLDMDYLELALQSFDIAEKLSSRWLVWETNPRFLCSNRGKDFAKVLLHLGKLGYGFAYRVLDSQFFGVPQKRRSLFLVGHSGDWRGPAGVLFEQTTAREYSEEDREQSTIVREDESLDQESPLVLPYKVAHQTPIYNKVPRIPYLKEKASHMPFVLIYKGLVRHFSPSEAELLQGFSENFTKVTNKVQPFGYKRRLSILGNSGCVPIYAWLFNRIAQVHELSIE